VKPIFRIFVFVAALFAAYPVFAASHPDVFITPQQLHAMIKAKTPGLVILEASWGGPKDYDAGHIPGAVHVNTDEIEYDDFLPRATTPADKLGRSVTVEEDRAKGLSETDSLPKNWWNLYPDKYLLTALAHMGVNVASEAVVYSKDPSAGPRLAWTLLYAGVKKVHLLSGGAAGWEKAGYELSTTPTARRPLKSFGADKPLHPEYLITIPQLREKMASGEVVACDVRTKGEYEGTDAPYSYIPTKGRIKGAVWAKAGDTLPTMDAYVNADGSYKSPEEVAAMWKAQGITGDKPTAYYCGTGWRSSLAFLYAYALGWKNIANFDSGWFEWSMGPDMEKNPMEHYAKVQK